MRNLFVNLFVIALVVFPTVVTALVITLGRGEADMSRSTKIDINTIYLGVAEVELMDKPAPYNKEIELYWVESDSARQAKKDLSIALANQWGKRIRNHKIIEVVSRTNWAGGSLRFIEKEKRPVTNRALP